MKKRLITLMLILFVALSACQSNNRHITDLNYPFVEDGTIKLSLLNLDTGISDKNMTFYLTIDNITNDTIEVDLTNMRVVKIDTEEIFQVRTNTVRTSIEMKAKTDSTLIVFVDLTEEFSIAKYRFEFNNNLWIELWRN